MNTIHLERVLRGTGANKVVFHKPLGFIPEVALPIRPYLPESRLRLELRIAMNLFTILLNKFSLAARVNFCQPLDTKYFIF